MVYHGFKRSTTPGTAVSLSAARIMASFVTIYPRIVSGVSNVGEVRIGGNPTVGDNVTLNPNAGKAIPTGSGMPLQPGDAGVIWPMMASSPVDLSTVFIDVDNSGDGVQFIYGRP